MLLVFDEVLSAFRMAPGGAQEYLGVTPDLCTLGKAVGGGFPLSVFGGRRDIMERLMPTGDCQHSGTYNGHPSPSPPGSLPSPRTASPVSTHTSTPWPNASIAASTSCSPGTESPARVQGLGARFGIYFGVPGPLRNYRDAVQHQRKRCCASSARPSSMASTSTTTAGRPAITVSAPP